MSIFEPYPKEEPLSLRETLINCAIFCVGVVIIAVFVWLGVEAPYE